MFSGTSYNLLQYCIALRWQATSLQPEIGGMFADEMDMLTIIKWRLTCKTNYYQAMRSLRRSLTRMLDAFVPDPLTFLSILNTNRGVFGGQFALAFVLRDPHMLPNKLDIYVSHSEFKALCASILGDARLSQSIVDRTYTQHTVLDALRSLVSTVLVMQTDRGTAIHIHRSYTVSSTAPITRASCTALSNFVTPHGFGCSHPLLTLNRRALLSDQDLPHIPIADRQVHDILIKHNFSLEFSPMRWPEFGRPVITSILDTIPTSPQDDSDIMDSTGTIPLGSSTTDSSSSVTTDMSPSVDPQHRHAHSEIGHVEVQHDYATINPLYDLNGRTYNAYGNDDNDRDRLIPNAPIPDVLDDFGTLPAQVDGYGDGDDRTHGTRSTSTPLDHNALAACVYFDGDSDHHAQDTATTNNLHTDSVTQAHLYSAGDTPRTLEVTNMLPDGQWGSDIRAYISSSAVIEHDPYNECTAEPLLAGNHDTDCPGMRSSFDLHYVRAHLGYAHAAAEDATDVGTAYGQPGEAGTDAADGYSNKDIVTNPDTGGVTGLSGSGVHTAPLYGTDEHSDNEDNDTDNGHPLYERCWRHLYICPSQGRYFGDRGSFVDFFDPLARGEAYCARRNIPPFGPMVVWRVLSNFDCDKNCDIYDDVLENGVTSIPVILRQDPSGGLHDIISDRLLTEGLGRRSPSI